MHVMTERKVEELLALTGHALCVPDIKLIQELDEIAGRVHGMFDGHERAVNFPVEAGNVLLYPLTIAKAQFISSNEIKDMELCYLLSLPNDGAEHLVYGVAYKLKTALFTLRLRCTERELLDSIDKVIDLSSSDDSDEKKTDWPSFIDILCSEYGGDPEYWLYKADISFVGEMIKRMTDRKQAQSQSEAGKAPIPTERIKSIGDFGKKAGEIKSLWSKQDG